MTALLNNSMTKFWDWIDTRGVIRRAVLFIAIYMLWVQAEWARDYAFESLALGKSDASIAAIIASLSAPATMLVGFVFKHYLESRTT